MKLSSKYEKIFFYGTAHKKWTTKCVTNIRKIISPEFRRRTLKCGMRLQNLYKKLYFKLEPDFPEFSMRFSIHAN